MVLVGQGKVEGWAEGWGLEKRLPKLDLGGRGCVYF